MNNTTTTFDPARLAEIYDRHQASLRLGMWCYALLGVLGIVLVLVGK